MRSYIRGKFLIASLRMKYEKVKLVWVELIPFELLRYFGGNFLPQMLTTEPMGLQEVRRGILETTGNAWSFWS